MSKLLENKQLLIHVAAEIVVIAGVSIYFYRKTKNLEKRLVDMETILGEYNTTFENTNQVVKRLCFSIQKQQNTINNLNAKINSLVAAQSKNKTSEPSASKKEESVNEPEVKQETVKPSEKNGGKIKKNATNNIIDSVKDINLESLTEETTSPISITINTDSLFDEDNDIPSLNKENGDDSENLDSEIQEELNELQDT